MAATLPAVDLTWIAPPLVLLGGAAAVSVLAHRLVQAADDARAAQRRFRRVEHALIPVRVETRRVRASVDRYPHR